MVEQQVIEELSQYRQKQARLQVLSTYSVGAGLTVSRLNEDDHLQELHMQLRLRPSYMYLNKREQQLETTANAYLTRYPAGIRAQLQEVERCQPADVEDEKLLRELRGKVQKVFAARGYDVRNDIDAVLDRLAEYQDLQAEINRIDTTLKALEGYKPEYARLLRLRYIAAMPVGLIAKELGVVRKTIERWNPKALTEYIRLVS